MLVLRIERLDAVTDRGGSAEKDAWPPRPERLVAALRLRCASREARDALAWLDAQDPPHMMGCRARAEAGTAAPDAHDLPDWLRRILEPEACAPAHEDGARAAAHVSERVRPSLEAVAPHPIEDPPAVELVWNVRPAAATVVALRALAREVRRLGGCGPAVRCRFVLEGAPEGPPVAAAGGAEPPRTYFSPDWIVLSDAGGDRPPLTAGATVGRQMRRALMHALPDPVPDWVSGRSNDGQPLAAPHLAVVPLADVGFAGSTGTLLGLALVPPRRIAERWSGGTVAGREEREALEVALDTLAKGRAIRLRLGPRGTWCLARAPREEAGALAPARYLGPARCFSTVTPIALDRHPRGGRTTRAGEAARIVAKGCERLGLPRPQVRVHSEAQVTGAPCAWPGDTRTGWDRDGALAGRRLTHATLRFPVPVSGPILTGAGRFMGLGLCLPIEDQA